MLNRVCPPAGFASSRRDGPAILDENSAARESPRPRAEGAPTRRAAARIRIAALVLVALVACGATAAQAAGTIVGRITLKGKPTPDRATPIVTNPDACGQVRRPVDFVGVDSGIRYVVVRITGTRGNVPVPVSPPEVDQRGCVFTPRVVIVGVDQPLKILNHDGVLHNFHANPKTNFPVNLGQPGYLKEMVVRFGKPEIVRVGCDIHPGMICYVVVTDTPFVAVTDENGAFAIPNVPAGSYEMSIWHERFGEATVQVKVTDGRQTTLDAQLTAN